MRQLFAGVSVAGILLPGEAYILVEERNEGMEPGSINSLYLIRTDNELLEALEFEYGTFYSEIFQLRKFLGWKKITADCCEFRSLCYDVEDRRNRVNKLYLHRIKSFKESKRELMEHF